LRLNAKYSVLERATIRIEDVTKPDAWEKPG
jgi:hypothetical protein